MYLKSKKAKGKNQVSPASSSIIASSQETKFITSDPYFHYFFNTLDVLKRHDIYIFHFIGGELCTLN